MIKTVHLLFFLILLFACKTDEDPRSSGNDLAELNDHQVFFPDGPVAISNPYARPAMDANVDGVEFFDFHPGTFDAGVYSVIRGDEAGIGNIRLHIPHFEVGTYVLGDSSGFAMASYDGIECTNGMINILKIENNRVTGSFEFTAGSHVITEGRFFDVQIPDEIATPKGYVFSAEINGEPYHSAVFKEHLFAIGFTINGYNETGNVNLSFSAMHHIEKGVYDLMDEEVNFTSVGLAVAKTYPQLLEGILVIESNNDKKGITGRFNARFDGYSIRNGKFAFFTSN
jgi:hypothetical protein